MDLKEKISKIGLKQKAVAEKLGLTPEYFNLIINGKATMSEDIRNKLNDLLSKVAI